MVEFLESVYRFLSNQRSLEIIKALVIICAGLVIARLFTGTAVRILKKRFGTHEVQLFRQATFYTILALFLLSALNQLDINLSVFLGAAGIVFFT